MKLLKDWRAYATAILLIGGVAGAFGIESLRFWAWPSEVTAVAAEARANVQEIAAAARADAQEIAAAARADAQVITAKVRLAAAVGYTSLISIKSDRLISVQERLAACRAAGTQDCTFLAQEVARLQRELRQLEADKALQGD